MSRRLIQYSEAFKLHVVSDIESGKFNCAYEASCAHGIGGKSTVRRWLEKYGKNHLLGKVVRVEKANEPRELKRLKDRVKQLETALADSVMDGALERAAFELLCEATDTDGDSFKKKSLGPSTQSPKVDPRPQNSNGDRIV